MLSVLFFIDKVKVVAQEDCVLLAVTRSQIEKLLRVAPKVWHLTIESLRVLNHWD
jgi:CRP-like cAMP-binding protein